MRRPGSSTVRNPRLPSSANSVDFPPLEHPEITTKELICVVPHMTCGSRMSASEQFACCSYSTGSETVLALSVVRKLLYGQAKASKSPEAQPCSQGRRRVWSLCSEPSGSSCPSVFLSSARATVHFPTRPSARITSELGRDA